MNSDRKASLRSRARSFQYAFEGCWYVLRSQQNAQIHAFITIAVIAMGVWLKLPARDWAVLVLTMAMVWLAEIVNTSLEAIVNLNTVELNPLAKIAKDTAAGAVLVSAAGAVVVGLLILGPPLTQRLLSGGS